MPRTLSSDPEYQRIAKVLGTVIRVVRKRKGVKVVSLAHDARLSENSVSGIESGADLPSIAALFRIAKALDSSVWEIVRNTERFVAAEELEAMLTAERKRERLRLEPKGGQNAETK
jgi:transcriptional regulator with XRE-family HTH domain